MAVGMAVGLRTLATTLAGATLAETAIELITGTLTTTFADALLAVSEVELFTGFLASTLDGGTLTADGIVLTPVSGSVVLLFDDVSLSIIASSRNAQRRRTQLSKFKWMKWR